VRRIARAFGAAVAFLALAAPAWAQAVAAFPLRAGEATFHIRATIVSDFTGHAAVSRAEYTGADLALVRGFAEVRVADMRTGIATRDRHLRSAMHADSFPVLRFELTNVEPGGARGDTVSAVLVGRLTIHGVVREVRGAGSVILGDGGIDVRAEFALDMRNYGVKPPVRMLGALRVAPDVGVGIHLVFGKTSTAPVP
jgi:polyisoprenoid-binding protein YceI